LTVSPTLYVADPGPIPVAVPVVSPVALSRAPLRWLPSPDSMPVLPEWTGLEDVPDPYMTSSSVAFPGLLWSFSVQIAVRGRATYKIFLIFSMLMMQCGYQVRKEEKMNEMGRIILVFES
jgi:hypothetical protein